jgi:hypothetical protein
MESWRVKTVKDFALCLVLVGALEPVRNQSSPHGRVRGASDARGGAAPQRV